MCFSPLYNECFFCVSQKTIQKGNSESLPLGHMNMTFLFDPINKSALVSVISYTAFWILVLAAAVKNKLINLLIFCGPQKHQRNQKKMGLKLYFKSGRGDEYYYQCRPNTHICPVYFSHFVSETISLIYFGLFSPPLMSLSLLGQICVCVLIDCIYIWLHIQATGTCRVQSQMCHIETEWHMNSRERITRGNICPSWIYLSDSHYTATPPLMIMTPIYDHKKSDLTHSCELMFDQTANNDCHHLSINKKVHFLQDRCGREMFFDKRVAIANVSCFKYCTFKLNV